MEGTSTGEIESPLSSHMRVELSHITMWGMQCKWV